MQQKKITRINTTLVSSPAAAAAVHSSHLFIIHPNASITPITVIIIIPFICIERVKIERKNPCHGIGGTGGNQKVIKQSWRGRGDKEGKTKGGGRVNH